MVVEGYEAAWRAEQKKKSQPEREASASGGIKVELTNKEV